MFSIVVDIIAENVRRGVVDELLYADDLVLMSETIKERFWNWKDALESKGLKVDTRKPKVMLSGSEGELFKSKIDPCGVCGRKAMINSVLCTKCGNWVLQDVQKQRELPLGCQYILFARNVKEQ